MPVTAARLSRCDGKHKQGQQPFLSPTTPAATHPCQADAASPCSTVKLYPQLSIAALKSKWHKEIALWYHLRALTSSGRLPLDDALTHLVPRYYAKATFYRILTFGNGIFWNVLQPDDHHPQTMILFRSLAKVAKRMGVTRLLAPREIPASSLRSVPSINAQLYASIHPTRDSKPTPPISRQSLEEITGVNRRTQIRYDKLAHTRRVPNYADQENPKGELYPQIVHYQGKRKTYPKHRRLGNSYYSNAHKAARGMLRRVNPLLAIGSLQRDEGPLVRRFFTSPKSFIKCPRKHPESFLLASAAQQCIKGRKEWIALAS